MIVKLKVGLGTKLKKILDKEIKVVYFMQDIEKLLILGWEAWVHSLSLPNREGERWGRSYMWEISHMK